MIRILSCGSIKAWLASNNIAVCVAFGVLTNYSTTCSVYCTGEFKGINIGNLTKFHQLDNGNYKYGGSLGKFILRSCPDSLVVTH